MIFANEWEIWRTVITNMRMSMVIQIWVTNWAHAQVKGIMSNNEAVEDSSRFASLAKKFKGQEITDKEIDPVPDLFRKGMEEEQFNTILKDDTGTASEL
jgi:hypothetical protein